MGKTAYRGYLIKETMLHGFCVEKDGFLICWAQSLEHARTMIDGLLDPE